VSRAKAVKEPHVELVKVTALPPFQLGHAGVVVGPGEHITVPVDVAERWRAQGLVE